MPKPKRRALLENILFGLAAICLAVGISALGFLGDLSRENRALLILISSVGVVVSVIGLFGIHLFWKWLRRRTRERVLSAWQASIQSELPSNVDVAHYLSEGTLRILAMQLFGRIGYGVLNKEDDEGYVRLMNPDGHLELVACKQQADPLEIEHLHELDLELKRTKAVQGFFWAPGGFSEEATHWTKQQPIILADRYGIGHLIDCVLAHHSTLLE